MFNSSGFAFAVIRFYFAFTVFILYIFTLLSTAVDILQRRYTNLVDWLTDWLIIVALYCLLSLNSGEIGEMIVVKFSRRVNPAVTDANRNVKKADRQNICSDKPEHNERRKCRRHNEFTRGRRGRQSRLAWGRIFGNSIAGQKSLSDWWLWRRCYVSAPLAELEINNCCGYIRILIH